MEQEEKKRYNGRHNVEDITDVIRIAFDFRYPSCNRTRIFGNICLYNTGRIVAGVFQSIETITLT